MTIPASVKTFRFQLLDGDGLWWTIPAEIVQTKMSHQTFVVHKSLDLDDSAWVVSHVETGGVVCGGATKAEVIATAVEKINGTTIQEFNEMVERIRTFRRQVEVDLQTD